MSDRLLTIEEAAEIVKLSPRQLYRAAREGRAPFFKPEGRWRIYENELHDWVRSCKPVRRSRESADPMPGPARRRSGGSLRSKVIELDARRRAA